MNLNNPTISHHQNPYESPTTQSFDGGFSADTNNYEEIRQYHLSHEASIRSFGLLYWLGGGLMFFGGGAGIIVSVMGALNQQTSFAFTIIGNFAVYMVIGLLQIIVGRGLRKFTSNGKIGGIIFGLIGLLGIPIGTLISGYMLYLLLSAKGKFIFSPQYQEVLKATPHIVYKTSIVVVVLGGLLLIVFALAIVFSFMNGA